MEFADREFRLQTNLAASSFKNLQSGLWKIGRIQDNPGLENESSDTFYETVKHPFESDTEHRCFKNKVSVVLYDDTKSDAHIIHWHRSGGWFCVSFSPFWDQFEPRLSE